MMPLKEAEDSEQDGKGYSDIEQTEDSEYYEERRQNAGYGLLLKFLMPFLCIK